MKLRAFFVLIGLTLSFFSQPVVGNPLIVFLHGFPEFSGVWKAYFPFFKDNYFVVAPDMRGYNLSARPKELKDYTLAKLTEKEKKEQIQAWERPLAIEISIKYYIASFLFKKQNRELLKGSITTPTLVFWGLNDSALVPENLDSLHQHISPLTVKTYKESTHWIHIEKPTLF